MTRSLGPFEDLYRSVNMLPPRLGTVGVRDPDYPCDMFDGHGYDGHGRCRSDGHYLCTECSELSPDAERFTDYGASGRLDRLRARAFTRELRAKNDAANDGSATRRRYL